MGTDDYIDKSQWEKLRKAKKYQETFPSVLFKNILTNTWLSRTHYSRTVFSQATV